MVNAFEKELGIPLPQCCSQGDCCRGASPSIPVRDLWQKAADGNNFARGFLNMMQPYASHAEAEAVVPGLVARTQAAALKNEAFQTGDDLVFYHCRYVTPDNRCGIHEDRPQFCRDYPDTPYVVMAPGCAFEPWAAACKTKVDAMRAEIDQLKDLKTQLNELQALQTNLKQTE